MHQRFAHTLSVLFTLFCVMTVTLATATISFVSADEPAASVVVDLPDEIPLQQKDWYEKYKTQKNIPQPSDMLLNTDPEPELEVGFEPLFNGKDLTGWTPKGGTCKFEVRDEQIVGTCVSRVK